jgi:ABC-type nitrate/sulfonate/bicarbonate transport system permease component
MKTKRAWLYWSIATMAGFVFLIFVWWLISYEMHQGGNRLLPYPLEVAQTLGEVLFSSEAGPTYFGMGWTIARLLAGFSASFVLGAILGTLAGLHPFLKNFLSPGLAISKAIPTAAVVLILVGVLYSYKGLPAYIPCFLVFLVAFPVIYEAFCSGISAEPAETVDALKLDGASRSFSGILEVYWPDSLSYILLAVAQSLGLSMKVSVMSEILINSSSVNGGIGGLIQGAELYLQMRYVIAYSLVAVFIIALIDIPMHLLKKKIKSKLEN